MIWKGVLGLLAIGAIIKLIKTFPHIHDLIKK